LIERSTDFCSYFLEEPEDINNNSEDFEAFLIVFASKAEHITYWGQGLTRMVRLNRLSEVMLRKEY